MTEVVVDAAVDVAVAPLPPVPVPVVDALSPAHAVTERESAAIETRIAFAHAEERNIASSAGAFLVPDAGRTREVPDGHFARKASVVHRGGAPTGARFAANSPAERTCRYDESVAQPIAGGDASQSARAQERAADMVGRTIEGRYRIAELVAMGAMGAVYKGEHLLMRKHVAIKILHPDIEDFPELVARFEREAIAGAHVAHPNVASASDFGKFDGDSYFLVLEYIEGSTLSAVMRKGPIEPLRAAKIIRQVALALGAAHERGIVHRDVKPNNVMLCEGPKDASEDESVKIIDFGLAKVPVEKLSTVARDPATDGKELTNAGVVMGTVAYMAPEVAYGMSAVDARADLYALGVVFYEMLAGKHLFDDVSPQRLFAAHTGTPPPPFAERAPNEDIPEDLERIVMRLLEKDRANRFPDAASLVAAIDAFKMRVAMHGTVSMKKQQPTSAAEIPGSPLSGPDGLYVPKRPTPPKKQPLWIVGAVVGGIGVLALVFVLGRTSKGSDPPAPSAPPASTPSARSGTPTALPIGSAARAPAPSTPSADSAPFLAAANADAAPAATMLVEALDKAPSALEDKDARAAATRAVTHAADSDAPEAAAALDRLVKAPRGIDVLYDVAASSDDPRAATKARAVLERPEVLAAGSVPMRIAYELLRADCQKRQFLFARASTEGDERSLAVLTSMMPPACDPHASACCFTKHGELERAIASIGARTNH